MVLFTHELTFLFVHVRHATALNKVNQPHSHTNINILRPLHTTCTFLLHSYTSNLQLLLLSHETALAQAYTKDNTHKMSVTLTDKDQQLLVNVVQCFEGGGWPKVRFQY